MPTDADQFAALRAKLNRLANDQRIAAERKALRATGEVILQAVQDLCPIQAGKPEGLLEVGELHASIQSYVKIANDAMAADGVADQVIVTPSTKVTRDVARWVEYGHAGRTADAKRTKPKPFLRPAQDACKQEAIDTYAETMTAEIKKAYRSDE